MSEVVDQFDVRLLVPTGRMRFALPPNTTTESPRLQQQWQSMLIGAWIWKDVPLAIVPQADFKAGCQAEDASA